MSTRSVDLSAVYELIYDPKFAPERSPFSHIDKLVIDSKPTSVLTNEVSQSYFEVDEVTTAIWNILDGKKTLSQVYEEAKKLDSTLLEKDVKDILVSLGEQGVLKSTEPEISDKRVELVSAAQLNIRIVKNSYTRLVGFYARTTRLLHKWELYVAVVISVAGAAVFGATAFLPLLLDKANFAVAGSTIFGFFFYESFLLLPVWAIHELSHGMMCAYYGGKPRDIGTGLYYFAPFFYCDTSDSWRLGKRARIMVSLAGPISTLVIGAFFVFGAFFAGGYLNRVLLIAAYYCIYGTLINFSPVIETDGYYALMDLTNIPNLRDESFGYFKRFFLRYILRKKVALGHYNSRTKRILQAYALTSIAWLALFGFTTVRMTYYYSQDAVNSVLSLAGIASLTRPFDLTVIGVSLVSLFCFGILMFGYGMMGKSAYDKARIRGMKLETIHDKRVAIFLPLSSSFPQEKTNQLMKSIKEVAKKYSPASSVNWEPPLCVAVLKLGKVDESLPDIRRDMQRVEKSFRVHYGKFLSKNLALASSETEAFSHEKKKLAQLLEKLASEFPEFERKEARREVSSFLKRRHSLVLYLLHSAFGSVWALELAPEDYRRTEQELFPSLIAEDLSVTDLYGEVEQFKKHTVIGLETIAKLSAELERESSEAFRRRDKYQAMAFIEPIKSRLVFVGRTEKIAQSLAKLGGLFLYQTWSAYMHHVLDEATLGLSSIRRAPSYTLGKAAVAKLQNNELNMLQKDLHNLDELVKSVQEALTRSRITLEHATKFYEGASNFLSDESFDIGMYGAIMKLTHEDLKGVSGKISKFELEFTKVARELSRIREEVSQEYEKRVKDLQNAGRRLLKFYPIALLTSTLAIIAVFDHLLPLTAGVPIAALAQVTFVFFFYYDRRRIGRTSRNYTAGFDAIEKLLFSVTQTIYDIVISSDVML